MIRFSRFSRKSVWPTVGVICCASAICQAQEMAQPTAEHKLLAQFAGEWTTKATAVAAPGEEPLTCEGTESATMLGGFWLVCHSEGEMLGVPVASLLTIGYEPTTKKYIGTFVCSMDSTLWQYTGAMEADGKKLVLETEGASPLDPGKQAKFRETLELVDPDHKLFTSYIQGDDGEWIEFARVEYRRNE